MGMPLESCAIDGCRFSSGYAPGVGFPAPAGASGVPAVLLFATDAALGYPHYRKHFRWLSGTAVVEQLRMAWRSAQFTVVRGREGTIVWVVAHDVFERTFDERRVKLITKPCTGYQPDSWHCCAGCSEPRPERLTLRSVQRWEGFSGRKVLYTDLEGVDMVEYLSDQPDDWQDRRFRIASSPPFENRWNNAFHYAVPIIVDGAMVVTRVAASKPQSALIDADQASFARAHNVIFTSRGTNGMFKAYFVERA